MQKDGSHDAGSSGLPPSNQDASLDGFQRSANMRNRLGNLAKWRIDESSIEFLQGAREIFGGYATVSRAFLASPSGGKDNTNQFDPTRNKGPDLGEPAGETSPRRKDVAVKKMKISGDMARVLGLTVREAEFLVGLSHENIIKLEGFVENSSKDILWLVFPWKENGTLRDFVASADWEIPERIHLINDVAKGVEYLHSRQPPILHGDLKSINVLVNSECRAVITDFGSARHLKPEDLNKRTKPAENQSAAFLLKGAFCASTNTITLTGNNYTLRWAAPELLYEEEPSLCSDIWALGWVAFEVITNSIPFQDVKDTVVIKRVIQGDLPSITDDTRISFIRALCSLMLPAVIPSRVRTSDPAETLARFPELLMIEGIKDERGGDYRSALAWFTEVLGLYTDAGNRKGKVTALMALGRVHRLRDESDQALSFYSKALQICTDIDDRQGRASALQGLADVHRLWSKYSQAIAFYSEALQIRTDIGDRRGRASALWGLAEAHRLRSEDSQATVLYSEALQIYTDLGDREGRYFALKSLAEVHQARSEYSQAITLCSEALQMSTEFGDGLRKARDLINLAEVHRAQNEFSQAITLLSEALQIHTDIGSRAGRVHALWLLAVAHHDQEDHGNAIRLYTEAAEAHEQLMTTLEATYEVRRLPPKENLLDRLVRTLRGIFW